MINKNFKIPSLYEKLNESCETEQIDILDFQKETIYKLSALSHKSPKEILYMIITDGFNNTINDIQYEIRGILDELEELKYHG